MFKYVLRRCGEMILTLFLIYTATFFLLAAIPGNALTGTIEKLPKTVQETMIAKYGYDKPVFERYLINTKNIIFKKEFGESITNPGQTLTSVIKEKMPVSARLGIQQVILGVTVGLILGIISAIRRGTPADYGIVLTAMILVSTPSLVMSLLLQKYCAGGSTFQLPIIGWPSGKQLWFGGWKFTILPTIAGACGYIAHYSRLMRTSMLESINKEYTLTARAKGLSEFKIITRHVFRNSFIPIVTILPGTIAGVIGGSLFIERVFAIPGIGQYFLDSIYSRDVPMIMGQTMLYTIIYLFVILITDILYPIVDPRIKIDF